MKKLIPLALVALLSVPSFAQEATTDKAQGQDRKAETVVWPAFFAVSQWPRTPDVVGLRLTIPFSTSQENVTGVDIGFWGKATYFEGIQLNVLRNEATDSLAGFQAGIYNTIGRGDLAGLQVGLFNEAQSICGVQFGLINVAGEAEGFQVGLVNRTETMHGYQIGLINVIREAEVPFMPIVNIGF